MQKKHSSILMPLFGLNSKASGLLQAQLNARNPKLKKANSLGAKHIEEKRRSLQYGSTKKEEGILTHY